MKRIQLSQGLHATVDDEDFDWLSKYKWFVVICGGNGGCQRYKYAMRRNGKKHILMHREILKPGTNELVDHKDGNGLNNQRANLRKCDRSQNAANTRSKKNAAKYPGCSYSKARKKWRAHVRVRGVRKCVGEFDDPDQAVAAYRNARAIEFGEFAA